MEMLSVGAYILPVYDKRRDVEMFSGVLKQSSSRVLQMRCPKASVWQMMLEMRFVRISDRLSAQNAGYYHGLLRAVS